MKIVLVTGGFDPLHSGHIKYFKAAKELGDMLVVGVNSDEWLTRKKGRPFMPFKERIAIIKELSIVDKVISFDDQDDSACQAIFQTQSTSGIDDQIIFANGGDRTDKNIPEMAMFDNVKFIFGVGGQDKVNSSSWILDEWKAPKTERTWGYYRVLHEVEGCKVKELTVDPGKELSMQRHKSRAEYWLVTEGKCVVNSKLESGYNIPPKTLEKHEEYKVDVDAWHQLTNPFDTPCRIVEIQYGDKCIEEDIERK